MASFRNLREPFDRGRSFETMKMFAYGGKQLGPNQPFDKTQVTDRRLRQLYESRYLKMTGTLDPPRVSAPPVQVQLGNRVEPAPKPQRAGRPVKAS